ncbi:hypothetical protein SAMN05421858_0096 [Haladaptatus litoreus]|uniref:Uncharacterized protein n=1 Tax=Haladaptatus litoreus TaxID=553468 RepID=A0A1N6UUE7_9EURY|nr:DUF5810 domain-containing protein [Haladaptatus litoreus]SIQ69092.1 hypothetical protein SAMN05421858_0096 [Haladaptatus litoreus]
MGFACPVCETPQSDGEHLANHLAFAAMLGDDDHETWLDEHAPGWSEESPDELASRVTEHASEEEYPQVFEDTVHDHQHHGQQEHSLETELQQTGGYGRDANMGAEAQSILNEARQMTEEMLEENEEAEEESDGEDENE